MYLCSMYNSEIILDTYIYSVYICSISPPPGSLVGEGLVVLVGDTEGEGGRGGGSDRHTW